jgi:branched-subunit amino acid ABC-type transport system permease component
MTFVTDWLDANAIAMVNGLAFGLLLYTISVGLSLILGAMNVLNLAHGVFYLVGAYTAVTIIGGQASWSLFALAVLVSLAFGIAGGAGLAALTAPLVRRGHQSHADQALLTLGLALVGGQLLLERFGGDTRSVAPPAGLDGSVQFLGHAYPTYRLFLIGVGLLCVVAVTLLMERTSLGALVRATVADPEMVRALGIDTRKVVAGVLSLGSALALIGGVLGSPFLGVYPGLDWQILLIGLVIVVVGGMGSVRGAFVGALIIGQAQVLGTQLVPQVAPFILLGAMAVVLTVRPRGLFGDVQLAR